VTIEVLLNADLAASEYRHRQVEGESTYTFTLCFYDIEDLEITGFSHQNVVQDQWSPPTGIAGKYMRPACSELTFR
jgi:hypothetical protein